MHDELNAFLSQIPEWQTKSSGELIPYLVYFLTVVKEGEAATATQVSDCFKLIRLKQYSNISAYLSRNSIRKKGKRSSFIKVSTGYQLERVYEVELGKTLQTGPARIETAQALNDLLVQLIDRDEKVFLQEAIDCYSIDARRATIVLVWILTVHHLYQYILKHKQMEFNNGLSQITDKRVKIRQVTCVDDFSEIPESIFIQIARSSNIISNDVRKILEAKLGIRNSSAHPSSVLISQVKTTDFIIDLIQNIILKYKM
jgi:hypothetical protein